MAVRRRTLARAAGALAATAVLAGLVPGIADAAPRGVARFAADGDGLAVTTKVTYRFDPAVPTVLVDTDLTITNEIPPTTRGGVIMSRYFTGYALGVTADAVDLHATSSTGAALATRTAAAESAQFRAALIDFTSNLLYRDTVTLRFSYRIPASVPRSAGLGRVNAAFASFPMFVSGDAGRSAVELQVPDRYDVELIGATMAKADRDGLTVYSEPRADPATFFVDVLARDDSQLITEEVDLDPGSVRVRAWPGDGDWATFVSTQVDEGIPVLEDLVALDWPRDDDTDVIESNTPYAYGYAGWFEPVNDVIEVGDELDQTVILHELTHRWFNDQLFSTRWINEGLAQELAAQAMTELEGKPAASKLPPSSDPGRQPLNAWSDPQLQSAATEQQEVYGYAASYAVVHGIVDALGPDATRRVFAAANADRVAYQGDLDPERQITSSDWRYFLDLVEEVGGAESAATSFESVVVTGGEGAKLDERAKARDAYAELVDTRRGWAAPLTVRQAMGGWRFDEAEGLIRDSEAVLDGRAALARRTKALGLREPRTLEGMYERANEDLDGVSGAIIDFQRAAGSVAAAEEAVDGATGPLAALGGLLSSADDDLADARSVFEAGHPAEAQAAAARAVDQADAQTGKGALLIAGYAVVASLVVLAVLLLLGRRRGRPGPPTAPGDDWGGSATA